MSADLWAAFGDGDEALNNPWSQPSPREERSQPRQFTPIAPVSKQETLLVDTNDKPISQAIQSPWDSKSTVSPVYKSNATSSLNNKTWTEYADADRGWSEIVKPNEPQDPWAASKSLQTSEVLWYAEQAVREDDDFGDFEVPAPATTSSISQLGFSKLSLESVPRAPSLSQEQSLAPLKPRDNPKAVQKVQPSKIVGEKVKTIHHGNVKVVDRGHDIGQQETSVKSPSVDPDDEWDEWSPDPVSKTRFAEKSGPRAETNQSKSIPEQSSTKVKAIPPAGPSIPPSNVQSSTLPASTLPPSNIPPPSILISLLSSLISTLPVQVETAMESFTSNASSSAVADKALSTAVRKCLAALRVAARIVAGRKVRWKRDTHLSQSMRIGPAGGGGKSGMKLTGVDRNESRREDREVAEFVEIWQNKLGSVRRALTSVNSKIGEPSSSNDAGGSKKLELPVISEVMLIRIMKEEDGGVKSSKACVLCGIKREERVDKVDNDVFDGFGEWWMEHWGHKECRAFWYQHEKYLQQR